MCMPLEFFLNIIGFDHGDSVLLFFLIHFLFCFDIGF